MESKLHDDNAENGKVNEAEMKAKDSFEPSSDLNDSSSRAIAAKPAVSSIIGAVLCGIVDVALIVYACLGGIDFKSIPVWGFVLILLIILALGFITLLRERRSEHSLIYWRRIRPFAVILAAPAGFYLLERCANEWLFYMDVQYVVLNIFFLAIIYTFIYFIGQRSRATIIVYLAACLIIGILDYFVIQFRDQPIMPADITAWQTAADVSGGYSYVLSERLLESIVVFIAFMVLLAYLPKAKLTPRQAIINTAIAVVLAVATGICYTQIDIEKAFNLNVNTWTAKDSYDTQGYTVCFFSQFQHYLPEEPEGYSAEAADEYLEEAGETGIGDSNTLNGTYEQPTVVVVMNETFSDLATYPGLEGTDAYPSNFHAIAEDAIETGTLYVSALGGGTCNSEFEFLTGSTINFIGGGIYPYTSYDLSGTTSLVSYFNSLGYTTHAIHPAKAVNWRRDRVYEQLGFDDFTDIQAFEDADTLRDFVVDSATYDYVLDLLEADDDPQFIFDITIQNHGGYETGAISEDEMVHIDLDGSEQNGKLDEYLSTLKKSDEEINDLVEGLESFDKPIIFCFFGDHQPSFGDWLFETTHDGVSADEMGLSYVQERYTVPYMIWANQAAKDMGITEEYAQSIREADSSSVLGNTAQATVASEEDSTFTSINYLGEHLVEYCGLPLSDYQKFLLELSVYVPAINMNGYLTDDGEWHWSNDISEVEGQDAGKLLYEYRIIQYDNLFNKDANW